MLFIAVGWLHAWCNKRATLASWTNCLVIGGFQASGCMCLEAKQNGALCVCVCLFLDSFLKSETCCILMVFTGLPG